MATNGDKKTYPRLPAKNWWTLRERFKQSVPGKVDVDYLQSVLGLTSTASAGNLIGPLRTLGLIDEESQPTDRALDWRHDESYRGVCNQMLEEVYPQVLRDAFPDATANLSGVANWFARNTGAGQGAAGGMASLYSLLTHSDPGDGVGAAAKPAAPRKAPAKKTAARKAAKSVETPALKDDSKQRRRDPSLNINVQVHISADASPDQIDQIFKSMGEHLYGGE